MKIEKTVLGHLERCYATTIMKIDGDIKCLVASESEGKECLEFSGDNFENSQEVWPAPGGTMGMVEIPSKEGEFLAVQNFFPTFRSAAAKIVHAKRTNGKWVINDFIQLPYVHRFDILTGADGTLYFLGGVLCNSKKEKADWSDPGYVVVGELPNDLENGKMELKKIQYPMTKHHGYSRANWYGVEVGICTADEGIFKCTPPAVKGGEWDVEKLMSQPTSDVYALDIDGDGEIELATIEDFHGSLMKVYKKVNGEYKLDWEYDGCVEFGHVITGGIVAGKPTFIFGARRGEQELFLLTNDNGKYNVKIVDKFTGPSNVALYNLPEYDLILSAGRMTTEIAVYKIYKD